MLIMSSKERERESLLWWSKYKMKEINYNIFGDLTYIILPRPGHVTSDV